MLRQDKRTKSGLISANLACLLLFAACSNVQTTSNPGSSTTSSIASSTSGTISSSSSSSSGGTTEGTTGTATLSWAAPTQNTDGTPLTDLAGFHVYYGTSASALTQVVDVSGASSTSVSVENLASGTYYFAVVAYTTAGIESGDSNLASITI
jgi:hypothetical protein